MMTDRMGTRVSAVEHQRGRIDVLNVNDWLMVDLESISMLATTSVPAVTTIDVGFSMRSAQQPGFPAATMATSSTSRGGRAPPSVDRASIVMMPSMGATTRTLRQT